VITIYFIIAYLVFLYYVHDMYFIQKVSPKVSRLVGEVPLVLPRPPLPRARFPTHYKQVFMVFCIGT
jgi:hypothetical protein